MQNHRNKQIMNQKSTGKIIPAEYGGNSYSHTNQ